MLTKTSYSRCAGIRTNNRHWLGDSDSYKSYYMNTSLSDDTEDEEGSYEKNIIIEEPVEKNSRTRASRVDRPAKTHFRKYSIGDKVIFKVPLANGGYELKSGTIAEFSNKNPRKYIIRDDKTYVTYLIHEVDISIKKEKKKEDVTKEITDEPIELKPADASIKVINPNDVVNLRNLKDDEGFVIANTTSTLSDSIPTHKVRNESTGHSVQQDLDSIENRVIKLENDNKKSKLQRLRNFYTKIGLISSLF